MAVYGIDNLIGNWNEYQLKDLIYLYFDKNRSISDISNQLHKSELSIKLKLSQLNLIEDYNPIYTSWYNKIHNGSVGDHYYKLCEAIMETLNKKYFDEFTTKIQELNNKIIELNDKIEYLNLKSID